MTAAGAGTAGRPTVTVDGEAVEVWPWARWRDAVTAWRPEAALRLERGEAWIEDARGNPVDPDGAVVDGASITVRLGDVR